MNIKNLISKNKKRVIFLVVALGVGIASGSSNMPEAEYNDLVVQKEQLDNQRVILDKQLEENKAQVNELQAKKDEVDRIAKEEAEARVEAERIAKEEAEIAEKEELNRIALEQQNSNDYISSNGDNVGSGQEEASIGKMVWLSASGSKYHSINNCGKMNLANAIQVSIESAKSQGFSGCSKC